MVVKLEDRKRAEELSGKKIYRITKISRYNRAKKWRLFLF